MPAVEKKITYTKNNISPYREGTVRKNQILDTVFLAEDRFLNKDSWFNQIRSCSARKIITDKAAEWTGRKEPQSSGSLG